MFKSKQILSRLLHINFSGQNIIEKNYPKYAEYCHILYENNGFISSASVETSLIKYIQTEEYDEPMVNLTYGGFSGGTKSLEIYIPKGQSFFK